jgi:hypothetical protein
MFSPSDKRIHIQSHAFLFICNKVNECIQWMYPSQKTGYLYNVIICITTHNKNNSRCFIFRSSLWQRDIKTHYLLSAILVIASLLRDMVLSSILPPQQLHHIQQSYIHLLCYNNYNITNNHSPEPREYCQGTIKSWSQMPTYAGMELYWSKWNMEMYVLIVLQLTVHKQNKINMNRHLKMNYIHDYIHSKSCSWTLCSHNPDLHSLFSTAVLHWTKSD